jgi:hypothetical protein
LKRRFLMKNFFDQKESLLVKAEEVVRKTLSPIPFIKIISIEKMVMSGNQTADLVIGVQIKDHKKDLIIKVNNNGEPRFARQAVNHLLRFRNDRADCYCIFMAPYISGETAGICLQDEIGSVDFAGNCRIFFDRVFLEKKGNPNPYTQKRVLHTLFSPAASRILRVVITQPKKKWKIKEMAAEAKVSVGLVANVRKLLLDREWISAEWGNFTLEKPDLLLTEWANNYNFRKNRIFTYYTLENPPGMESLIAKICQQKNIRYALTGFSAAARLAPAVRYNRSMIYVEAITEELIHELSIKPVTSGANVLLLLPFDEGVFHHVMKVDKISLVTPVQAYLDLVGFRGRGEESAKVLLEQVIKPKW